jgi:hypothetical protein
LNLTLSATAWTTTRNPNGNVADPNAPDGESDPADNEDLGPDPVEDVYPDPSDGDTVTVDENYDATLDPNSDAGRAASNPDNSINNPEASPDGTDDTCVDNEPSVTPGDDIMLVCAQTEDATQQDVDELNAAIESENATEGYAADGYSLDGFTTDAHTSNLHLGTSGAKPCPSVTHFYSRVHACRVRKTKVYFGYTDWDTDSAATHTRFHIGNMNNVRGTFVVKTEEVDWVHSDSKLDRTRWLLKISDPTGWAKDDPNDGVPPMHMIFSANVRTQNFNRDAGQQIVLPGQIASTELDYDLQIGAGQSDEYNSSISWTVMPDEFPESLRHRVVGPKKRVDNFSSFPTAGAILENATPTFVIDAKERRFVDTPEGRKAVDWVKESADFVATAQEWRLARKKRNTPEPNAIDAHAGSKKLGGNELTRVTDKSAIRRHRRAICPYKKRDNGRSCDEYPFASTAQGGINAVDAEVDKTQNVNVGRELGSFHTGFYTKYRIMDGDKFWVYVKNFP